MEYHRSPEFPNIVERGNPYGKNLSYCTVFINFKVEQLPDVDEAGNKYEFYRVELKPGQYTHDGVVNAIIRARYPQDEMEAITNNYLAELDIEGLVAAVKSARTITALKTAVVGTFEKRDINIVAAYNAMQEWRNMAKDVAVSIFDSGDKSLSNLINN